MQTTTFIYSKSVIRIYMNALKLLSAPAYINSNFCYSHLHVRMPDGSSYYLHAVKYGTQILFRLPHGVNKRGKLQSTELPKANWDNT